MIPPYVAERTRSAAERKFFVRLRDELSDDWTVLHSLGVAEHARKPWAEVDFVLVGPLGVFCLEVKGGRVSRASGIWEFTDRDGRVSKSSEGPFEQVGSVTPQLHHHLRAFDESLAAVLVGFGIVTPDIEFNAIGPDVDLRVVCDLRDAGKPVASYVKRLGEHWQQRFPTKGAVPPAVRARIVQLLRPDFDLRPSLRSRVSDVNGELLSLTLEQYRVLDGLDEAPRVLVRGGAGTGKTLLAREEAVRQAAAGKKVLLCCFNRALAEYLRGGLEDVDGIEVAHLHGLMATLIREAGMQDRLQDIDGPRLFSVFYPNVALDALVELDRLESYDVLIVDEAQDLLLDEYVDVMDALLKGGFARGVWRVFYDPRQNIYQSQNPRAWQALEGGFRFRLSVNCRNTQAIAVTAGLLAGAAPDEVLRAEGPEVELIWYRDADHVRREVGRLLGRLLGAGELQPEQVVVLTRQTLGNCSLRGALPGCAIPVGAPNTPGGRFIPHSTISGFKGLEADAIVLAELDDLTSDESALLNYVGASRARAYLALVISESARETFKKLGSRLGEALARSR
ncbi:MAG: NERD domain-containing protein [Chloroflexi bacterium]|nr:NERD domain-containing protein [Chloroflexota bacterium]